MIFHHVIDILARLGGTLRSPVSVHSPVGLDRVSKPDKPHPLTIVRAKSVGSSVAATKPPSHQRSGSKGEVGVASKEGEAPHQVASRLNRSSSTLVLHEPLTSGQTRGGSVPVLGSYEGGSPSASEGSHSRPISLAGLPQGPGPLHIAAK